MRRVPVVTQIAQTECGVCSAVAILRYHGRDESLGEARTILDAGRDGLALKELRDYLEVRGMQTKSYRVGGLKGFEKVALPAIAFWDEHHFVVIERINDRSVVVMDPAIGRRRLSLEAFTEKFSGFVVTASPGENFEPRRAPRAQEWRRMDVDMRGMLPRFAIVFLLTLATYGAILGIPFVTRYALDHGAINGDAHQSTWILAAIIGLAATYWVVHVLRVKTLAVLVSLLGDQLMTRAFSRLLRLPLRYFSTRLPGELLFRLNSVTSVRDLLSARLAQALLDIGTLVIVSVYLAKLDLTLAAVATLILATNIAALLLSRRKVAEIVDEEIARGSESQSRQLDAIVSALPVKMGAYGDALVDTWSEGYGAALGAMRRRMLLQEGYLGGLATTSQMFGPIVILVVGLGLVRNGTSTLGSVVAAQALSATYFALATSVLSTLTEFQEASRYLARINEFKLEEPESEGGDLRTVRDGGVKARGLSFSYPGSKVPVLDAVSLDVEPGTSTAIVGQSGSGKSTLARLLCGLYTPTSGEISIDGVPLPDYHRDSLRRSIGFVPQEVFLHNRTILDNLSFVGPPRDPDEMIELARATGLLGFVDELPMGYRTMVSEMGTNFSGGQRQRLALVAALIHRPKLLVLDEATSSLDAITERRVIELLAESAVTQIVIAHRLTTIAAADHVVVLDHGRVVEAGSHSELRATEGVYSSLYQAYSSPEVVGYDRA